MTYKDHVTTPNAGASTTLHAEHLHSEADVQNDQGRFKPWQAIKVFEKRLPGLAQLAAIHIARRSDAFGIAKGHCVSVEFIAQLLHCTESTASKAIRVVVASGLLTRRLTRDGYVYTWARDAYNGGGVVSGLDRRCFPNNGHRMWESITPDLVCDELERVFRRERSERYRVPQDLPLNAGYCVLSPKTRAIVGANILFAAQKRTEEPAIALEATITLICKKFLAMDGNGDFLKKAGHPLEELGRNGGRDLGRILEEVLKTKPYRPQTIEQLEQAETPRYTHERVKVVEVMPRLEFVAPRAAKPETPVVQPLPKELSPEMRTLLSAMERAPNLAELQNNVGFARELMLIAAENGRGLPDILKALPAVNAAAKGQTGSSRVMGAALKAFGSLVAA